MICITMPSFTLLLVLYCLVASSTIAISSSVRPYSLLTTNNIFPKSNIATKKKFDEALRTKFYQIMTIYIYEKDSIIVLNCPTSNDAPPTSPPSTSGFPNIILALSALTEPPYKIGVLSATA